MPKTCLRQSHRLTTTRFPNGDWVASCSCGEYMSRPYWTPDQAMDSSADEHNTAIMPPVDVAELVRERYQLPSI